MTKQITMTGDDWTSDRDKRDRARADAAVKKTGLACAVKLERAAEALHDYLIACMDAGHEDRMGAGDGRRRLAEDLTEYAGYLNSVYGKDMK